MTSSRLNLNSGTLISTHILTKRMTALCRYWHNLETFQLTSSRRGWPVLPCTANLASVIFQLTSSRRGWPYQSNRHGEGLVFQLTSSRRGWQFGNNKPTKEQVISTHILTKRMTGKGKLVESWCVYFNSHPHEEDDSTWPGKIVYGEYFNSHPHEEDDPTS